MNFLTNLVNKQPLVAIAGAVVLALAVVYIKFRNDPTANMMTYVKYGGAAGLLGAGVVYMLRKGNRSSGRVYDDVSVTGSEDLMSEPFDS